MDQAHIVYGTGAVVALAACLLWLWALVDKVLENQDALVDVLRRIGRHRVRQSIHGTDLMDR